MEYLDIKVNSTFIPTCDENGKVIWGEITAITRHDPGNELFEIKTQSGREVIVTASKSLIIWDETKQQLIPKLMKDVKVNDFVPITMNLCNSPVIKNENITLNDAIKMGKECMKMNTIDTIKLLTFILQTSDEIIKEFFNSLIKENTDSIYTENKDILNLLNLVYSRVGLFVKFSNNKIIIDKNINIKNDIVLDPIVEINSISPEKYPKMYDLTIPSTLNFSLASGLIVRDTAQTGYIQRKMAKILEDLTASYVGTVNDGAQNIVQFNYGEDNLEASKLIKVGSKNDKSIFSFIDIRHTILKCNIDYEWKQYLNGIVTDKINSKKRKLTKDEITFIKDNIIAKVYEEFYTVNSNKECVQNTFSTLEPYIHNLEIYPEMLEYLQKEITRQLKQAIVNSGESVGHVAASSMGEQNTQSSLNSVVGDTNILIMINDNCIQTTIGKLIDDECNNGFESVKYNGQNDTTKEAYAEIVNLEKIKNKEFKIQSIDENGKVEWRKITKFIRHPLYTKLIKVITESGREVIATTGLSFLIKNELGKIVPIEGSKLQVGDRIPFSKIENECETYTENVISIEEVSTEDIKYVYDFEVPETGNFKLFNQMHVRDSFHSSGSFKANLTSGLSRLEELMNATKNPKSKSLTIYFDSTKVNVSDYATVRSLANIHLLSRSLNDYIKNTSIEVQPTLTPIEQVWYHIYQVFVARDDISNCKYRLRLQIDPNSLYLSKRTLYSIAKSIETVFIKGLHFYVVCSPDYLGIIDIWVEDSISDPSTFFNAKGYEAELLLEHFVNNENKMYHLIKKIILPKLKKLHISGIEGIKEVYYDKNKNDEWFIQTKGGSLKCIYYNPLIDHYRSVSNDMWEVNSLFGIESSKKWLKEEFSQLLSVNHRHLDILVDKMTFAGSINAVSIYGLDRKLIGPLSKAVFERPVACLLTAAQKSEYDALKSISSCVATGKLGRFGTGIVDLISDNELIINNPYAEKYAQQTEQLLYSGEELPEIEEDDEDMITIEEPLELNEDDIY